jgi:hypothetical protein
MVPADGWEKDSKQKSYKINRLIIVLETDIFNNDIILLNIIKYFSLIYDEIIVDSLFSISYLRNYFYYDKTILFETKHELIDYKNKVIIKHEEYSEDSLYKLFNITKDEINNLIK